MGATVSLSRISTTIACAAALTCALISSPLLAKLPRYAAVLADGTRLTGSQLTDWHAAGAQPKLDGRPLAAAENPWRWISDRRATMEPLPSEYIEFFGGDRLPGSVVHYQALSQWPDESLPPYLLVKISHLLPSRGGPKPGQVRILTDYVRRIVWKSTRRQRYEPGSLFLRDGKKLTFRAARFQAESVVLLADNDQREIPFLDIAELHMHDSQSWQRYYDELAALGVGSQTRLLQLESTTGLKITTSMERFRPLGVGNAADPKTWVHAVGPAWSWDTILVPAATVRVRRQFAPNQIPLSRLIPIKHGGPAVAGGWTWRTNQNSHGGPLRSGGEDHGWGFGVHGFSELRFRLPAIARAVRSRFGLDQLAGAGGCVRARILLGSNDTKTLYESPLLIGSARTIDTGRVVLPKTEALTMDLILQVDTAHEDRPRGADPLDIRDFADWIEPQLELDATTLQAEVRRRTSARVTAWRGWTADDGDGGTVRLASYWNALAPQPEVFRRGVQVQAKPISIRRKVSIGPNDNWLLIQATSPPGAAKANVVEVSIDGKSLGQKSIPVRDTKNLLASPLLYPVTSLQGKTVTLVVTQLPGGDGLVDWKAIRMIERVPTLFKLFEDEGEFAAVGEDESGAAELTDQDPFCGSKAVRIKPQGRFRLVPQDLPARIRAYPALGEYRYIRFAIRKSGGGRVCLELNHGAGQQVTAAYDAGHGKATYGYAKRSWQFPLPDAWVVIERDLFADFGAIDVESLTLSVPDGSHALIDHVYLARSPADFALAPTAPSAAQTNLLAQQMLVDPASVKALAATVLIDAGGRYATGVIVSKDGYVVTAAHFSLGREKQATLFLHDGRQVGVKPLGAFREPDFGLMKIVEAGPWPFLKLAKTSAYFPKNDLYLSVAYLPVARAKQKKPAMFFVDPTYARPHLHSLWSNNGNFRFADGYPLVNSKAEVVGIYSHFNKNHAFVYGAIDLGVQNWDLLKTGEVRGNWPRILEPNLGVKFDNTDRGARVAQVFPGTHASEGHLKIGDLVTAFNGKAVKSDGEIIHHTRPLNPGQTVALKLQRGDKTLETKIILANPRPFRP